MVEAFLVAVAAVVMAEVEAARAEIASDVVGVDRTGVLGQETERPRSGPVVGHRGQGSPGPS